MKDNGHRAVTVGFFDGVHAGHRFLIRELKKHAAERNLKSCVITFRQHPRKVLQADFQPQLLSTPEEKYEYLLSTGVDEVIMLDFDLNMANLTAREFIHHVLADRYQVKFLLAGHDHRFGRNREEGFDKYLEYGAECAMDVVKAERYTSSIFLHISSSEIRNALLMGEVKMAASLLTYPYSFEGIVVKGHQIGRKIGFPTANIQVINPDKLLPGSGVYAVKVNYLHKEFPGMMNIGVRPTLQEGNAKSYEVHIFDFTENIYNEQLKITFIEKIRDEKKFSDMDALTTQLTKDKNFTEQLFR